MAPLRARRSNGTSGEVGKLHLLCTFKASAQAGKVSGLRLVSWLTAKIVKGTWCGYSPIPGYLNSIEMGKSRDANP
jgi:hypothetical protein